MNVSLTDVSVPRPFEYGAYDSLTATRTRGLTYGVSFLAAEPDARM